MHPGQVILERKGAIAYITINRPPLNTLTEAAWDELASALDNVRRDDEVLAVIITGVGDRAFSAGADVKEMPEMRPVESLLSCRKLQQIMYTIENLGKPTIAAINGYALGGGCEIALACSMRIASERARMAITEINLGLIPGIGACRRLTRLVGKGRAMELLLTGDMVDADEAYRIGLVNRVVPHDELMTAAEEMARRVTNKAPVAVTLTMAAINASEDASLDNSNLIASSLFGLCVSTEEFIEGRNAFLEKRQSQYKNR